METPAENPGAGDGVMTVDTAGFDFNKKLAFAGRTGVPNLHYLEVFRWSGLEQNASLHLDLLRRPAPADPK
jgi:hypothetical protein